MPARSREMSSLRSSRIADACETPTVHASMRNAMNSVRKTPVRRSVITVRSSAETPSVPPTMSSSASPLPPMTATNAIIAMPDTLRHATPGASARRRPAMRRAGVFARFAICLPMSPTSGPPVRLIASIPTANGTNRARTMPTIPRAVTSPWAMLMRPRATSSATAPPASANHFTRGALSRFRTPSGVTRTAASPANELAAASAAMLAAVAARIGKPTHMDAAPTGPP